MRAGPEAASAAVADLHTGRLGHRDGGSAPTVRAEASPPDWRLGHDD